MGSCWGNFGFPLKDLSIWDGEKFDSVLRSIYTVKFFDFWKNFSWNLFVFLIMFRFEVIHERIQHCWRLLECFCHTSNLLWRHLWRLRRFTIYNVPLWGCHASPNNKCRHVSLITSPSHAKFVNSPVPLRSKNIIKFSNSLKQFEFPRKRIFDVIHAPTNLLSQRDSSSLRVF